VPVAETSFSQLGKDEIRKRFDRIYEKLYGRTYRDSAVEFINFKVRASLPERLLRFPKAKRTGRILKEAVKGSRPAYSGIAGKFIPFTVYDRYKLFPDAAFKGLPSLRSGESTVIVGEDASVKVDAYGFLWIDLKTAHSARPKAQGKKK